MDDIFNMNPNAGDQGEAQADAAQTRVMSPVEAEVKPQGRRRRTERNRDQYDNAELPVENAETAENAAPVEEAQKPAEATAPAQTTKLHLNAQKPAAPASGTTVVPRFQTRYNPPVPGSVPSQGVPRPASLNIQTPRRPESPATPTVAPTVRRPVQAEGYTPVKPLGVSRAVGSEQETAEKRFGRMQADEERRSMPMLDDEDEYIEEDGKKGGKGLVIAIIALLAVAAIVLGLLLIPADMPGPIGDVKRSIVGMFGSAEQDKEPAAAQSLMASISKDTAPYVVNLSVTTNKSVTDVRIADVEGAVLPTTVQTKIDITEDSTVWTLQMTLETEYEGTIHVQINDGETWIDEDDQLKLTTGDDMKLKISDVPVNPLTAVMTAAATATATLTAGSENEPTVSPAMDEIPEFTSVPVTAVPASDPTEAPALQNDAQEAASLVTATPTLALTPTPTVRVTEAPTPVPTEAPTPEPTPEPTPVPTATPAPTAVPTPKLEAVAAEAADPSLIATQKIYNGTKLVESYQRNEDDVINMPAGDAYLTRPYGVLTFRGNAFRMNAAVGTVTEPTGFAPLWSVPAGSLEAKSRTFYGFSMYSQPVIITWPIEIRQAMDIDEARKAQSALKEVIIAGQDGKIYFHDLKDGTATREAINLGYAMRSTPSLHPLGYPVLTVGQYSNKLPNKTGKTMGLYYYSLINSKQLRLIDGLDGDRDRMYYNVGAFDTSALIDRNSNTLIAVGTNGMLYTEKLDLKFIANNGGIFEFNDVKEQAILMSHTKKQETSKAAVESSLAMYGSYAFYADMGGILRCVDTTTMTTVWAVDTGDAVRAAIALDLDEETHTLWLYTANTITNRSKNGDVTIRRFNAMTGEEDWSLAVNSTRKTGKKDAYSKDVTAGAVASPVIGQNGLGDLVYFTLSSVSAAGAEQLTGTKEAIPSVLLALNKETHEVVWAHKMDAYSYSSPLAVYDENGRGWIVQGCSNGTLYLLDGLTGSVINTMQVNGIIEGSPAAFGNTIVFGTTGKDEKSQLHAVTLK